MKISSNMDQQKDVSVVVATPAVHQPVHAGGAAGTVKKYRVALAVLGCVTVLALVGAFVGVFALHSKSINTIIKHYHGTDFFGQELDEKVEVDEQDNVARFTVTGGDGETFHVVQDYNMKLVIMSVPESEGSEARCLVSVLNASSSEADIEELTQVASPTNVDQMTFVQADKPVATPDFLPRVARNMCSGRKVYWATEQCGDAEPQMHGREKRQTDCLYPTCYSFSCRGRYCCHCYRWPRPCVSQPGFGPRR